MARETHPKTLFHLVPTNQVSHDALLHPDNKHRVSSSESGLGLEVGYHVPSTSRGHVITRLGRDADLILSESTRKHPMSGVHIAFEFHPKTHLVLLSVRSKRISSVTFAVFQPTTDGETIGENITGDGVILYEQNYKISIGSYQFNLIWRKITVTNNTDSLKALALQGYETSLQIMRDMRSRDRPTEVDSSEAQLSWHITRLNTTKGPILQDVIKYRKLIGEGAFGQVYSAADQTTGFQFAIKVVRLSGQGDVEAARAKLHREIKVMQRVKHKHIIEYLGSQHFHTPYPEIFMPLRDGSLTSLAKSPPPELVDEAVFDRLCIRALSQMLSALDCLASQNLIHRDVKPDNVLYEKLETPEDGGPECGYHFQLADFGLANYGSQATTHCGTGYYMAPEFSPFISGICAGQSPKLDVWSLVTSMIAVRGKFNEFPPRGAADFGVILTAFRAAFQTWGNDYLEPMARLHPDRRASAAQMLVRLFDGNGLTTPKSVIPPIAPDVPAAEPSSYPQTGNDRGEAPQWPTAATRPLIVYPQALDRTPDRPPLPFLQPPIPNRGGNLARPPAVQLQPIRKLGNGVAKRRPETRSSRAKLASSHEETLMQEAPVLTETHGWMHAVFPE